MNRRIALSSLIAGTATAVSAPVVFGAAEWCEDDPLVVIKTPTGNQLPLHVTNYAEGLENQVYLTRVPDNQEVSNPWISWTVVQSKKGWKKPSGTGASAVLWDVTISVAIHTDPGDGKRFRTKTVASSGLNATGTRYAQALGTANRKMEMRFSIWA
jgi:hypothetical protein